MSCRRRLRHLLEIILRVPPLFLIDAVLNGTFRSILVMDAYSNIFHLRGASLVTVLIFLLFVVTACVVLFSLTTQQLFIIYSLLLATGVLCLSHNFNVRFLSSQAKHQYNAEFGIFSDIQWELYTDYQDSVICNIVIQCLLAFCYNCLIVDIRNLHSTEVYPKLPRTYLILLLPIASSRAVRSIPEPILRQLSLISAGVAGFDLQVAMVTRFGDIVNAVRHGWMKAQTAITVFGFQYFIESQWHRLNVPDVFRVFWTSRFAYHVLSQIALSATSKDVMPLQQFPVVSPTYVFLSSFSYALSRGCDNWLAVVGMASVISKISLIFDVLFIRAIGASVNEHSDERDVGILSTVLFVILALQTGLTSYEPTVRLARLHRNLCLIVIAVLHSQHIIVHTQLMSLSTGQYSSAARHLRSLTGAILLIIIPAIFVNWLWSFEDRADTWLLALTALGFEIIIKVVVSLLTYGLFVIDSWRGSFWNRLDDYVYIVQSAGNTIEFIIGVFLFGNGVWKFVFESGGTVRAVMMCLHAYFNIWRQAQNGWTTFVRRQSAAKKIDQLPMASELLLSRHDDVCAICYQSLNDNARVTQCGHLFHGVCLRKWLYVKDVCPMCHQPVSARPESDGENDSVRPTHED